MNKKQNYYLQTDLILLFLGFVIISLLSIYSADSDFVLRQVAFFGIGACIVAATQFIDLEQIYKASIYIYIGAIGALALLFVSPAAIAPEINGAKSWFQLPGLSIQPAEFGKIATIIFLSATITRHKEKVQVQTVKTDIMLLLKLIVFTLIPVGLIMLQPDFGTAMVYLFIAGMMIILSGINWKIITTLIVGLASAAAAAIGVIIRFPQFAIDVLGVAPYQVDRILTWFDPSQQSADATFQFERAHMALGSGQLFGKGLGNTELHYPEAHTDFIFAVIGETFGFIGSAIVIFLYFMLLYRLVTLGLSIYKHSPFGTYFCFGFLSLLLVHVFQNIGMTVGIMPITGIPLLLISYGGSSVISTMLGMAVVYRVAVEHTIQNDYLFK